MGSVLQVAELSLRCNDLAGLNQQLVSQLEQQHGQLQQVCPCVVALYALHVAQAVPLQAWHWTGCQCACVLFRKDSTPGIVYHLDQKRDCN